MRFCSIQNSDIREPDTRGLPRRSFRREGRGSNAAGSGLNPDRGGAESDSPRPAWTIPRVRSKIVPPPIPRLPQTPLLGHLLPPFFLLLPARSPASLSVRLLRVHGRGGRDTVHRQTEPNSCRVPTRDVVPPLRGLDGRNEPRREMRGSNGGRCFTGERVVRILEQGAIATLVDGKANEIGQKRGEFPSKFHGKGGGLQRREQQQVGESEYGDVVVTREMEGR